MLVTDGRGDAERVWRIATAALAGGVRCVQLREPQLPARALLELVRALRPRCAAHGALLLVNDRIDVAIAGDAHGAHVGGRSLPGADARALLGPARWLSVATHDAAQLAAAVAAGADSVTLSPVFPTQSHPGAPTLGVAAAAQLAAHAPVPVVWLGGISVANVAQLAPHRPAGIAVMRALCDAADPEAAARALLERLGRT